MDRKMDRKTDIRQFLARHVKGVELTDDQDIFALGFVNSLLAIQLVDFVEKEFSIEVDDDDLDLDNFRSVDAIDAFVNRKLDVKAAAS